MEEAPPGNPVEACFFLQIKSVNLATPTRYRASGHGPCSHSGAWRLESLPGGVDRILGNLGGDPIAPFILSFAGDERRFLRYQRIAKGIKWFSKRATPQMRASVLGADPQWKKLRRETRWKLALATSGELQRMTDLYLAIEDCFVLSSPELFGMEDRTLPDKIWKWVFSNAVHYGGIRHTNSMWKAFTSHIKALAIKSREELPHVSHGTIFFNNGCFAPKLLKDTPLAWLARVCERGLQTKSEGTRLMHLVSTRGTPAPTKSEMGNALIEHAEVVAGERDFPLSSDRVSLLRRIGVRLGRYAASRTPKGQASLAHLSLSNSASIDGPRKLGGRARAFGMKFAEWANSTPVEDREGRTIFGESYSLKAGVKIFRTMCRKEVAPEGDLIESDNTFDIEVDFADFKYEDRIHGLDSRTGYQMLQFALEEGIRSGCISGKPWYTPGQLHEVVSPPCVVVAPVGEPGGKTRTITVSEDWVTQFLSPFGHEMISYLEKIPAANCGVSKAAMAYEYAKRIGTRQSLDTAKELCFLTSDLTQASEYLEHEYSKALLEGFVNGAGLASPYMELAIKLLCSPRFLEGCSGAAFPYPHSGYQTRRACLMGDPGTKAALMLTMLASEEEAYLQYQADLSGTTFNEVFDHPDPPSEWRCFAVAGDDHIAIGPEDYLRLIKAKLVANGGVISPTKAFISSFAAYYTEELLLKTGENKFYLSNRPIWKVPYNETIHVDSLKVRLLSPVSKVTLARDEKNPALGKGRAFAKKLAWLPDSWESTKELFLGRFYQRFRGFLELSSAMTYLPKFLGGLGFPIPEKVPAEEIGSMVMRLPPIVRRVADKILQNAAEPMERNALWAFASNTTFRGINMRTMAEEQLVAVFTHFVDDSVHLSNLRETLGVEENRWESLRRRDKQRLAKSHGLISLSEAIQLFERPTYFKEILADLSLILSEDPLNQQYNTARRFVLRFCRNNEMTLASLELPFPELFRDYRRYASLWFARQAEIETWAFTRIRGSSQTGRLTDPRPVDRGGYNTRSWPQRMADLVDDLLFHTDRAESTAEGDERLLSFVLEHRYSTDVQAPYVDEVYIRRGRIVDSLCTLSTPLRPRLAWTEESERTTPVLPGYGLRPYKTPNRHLTGPVGTQNG
jgi:hypothetical protein